MHPHSEILHPLIIRNGALPGASSVTVKQKKKKKKKKEITPTAYVAYTRRTIVHFKPLAMNSKRGQNATFDFKKLAMPCKDDRGGRV